MGWQDDPPLFATVFRGMNTHQQGGSKMLMGLERQNPQMGSLQQQQYSASAKSLHLTAGMHEWN